tara:strand:- start:1305 stop:1667 length:363 start_codon:yes stop_codon:yes gene_type:complete
MTHHDTGYKPDKCLSRLKNVFEKDNTALHEKDKDYQGSWKKRGGVGAFMMLCRKWDRIEARMRRTGYDIFKAIEDDTRQESVLDDIQDLRRYLALVEAEMEIQLNDDLEDHGVGRITGMN